MLTRRIGGCAAIGGAQRHGERRRGRAEHECVPKPIDVDRGDEAAGVKAQRLARARRAAAVHTVLGELGRHLDRRPIVEAYCCAVFVPQRVKRDAPHGARGLRPKLGGRGAGARAAGRAVVGHVPVRLTRDMGTKVSNEPRSATPRQDDAAPPVTLHPLVSPPPPHV